MSNAWLGRFLRDTVLVDTRLKLHGWGIRSPRRRVERARQLRRALVEPESAAALPPASLFGRGEPTYSGCRESQNSMIAETILGLFNPQH